jgi:hypothetical protein
VCRYAVKKLGTAVISKSTAVVFVFVDHFMIPLTDEYLKMTTWITVRGDTERTLTVAVLTGFKAVLCRDHGKAGKLTDIFVGILNGI